MDTLRTVLESKEFKEARRVLDLDVKRLDEILEGVMEVVARKPDEFPLVYGTEVRRVKTRPFPPHIPSLGIFFRYDGETVTLEHVYRADVLEDVALET